MAATASDKLQPTQIIATDTGAIGSEISNRPKSNLSIKRKLNRHDIQGDTLTVDQSTPSSSTQLDSIAELSGSQLSAIARTDATYTSNIDAIANYESNKNNRINLKFRSNDDVNDAAAAGKSSAVDYDANNEIEMEKIAPLKPQRRKQSYSVDKGELAEGETEQQQCGCIQIPIEHYELVEDDKIVVHDVSFALKLPIFLI